MFNVTSSQFISEVDYYHVALAYSYALQLIVVDVSPLGNIVINVGDLRIDLAHVTPV